MRRFWFFLPISLLALFAGYLGLRAGQIPREAEIINHYVAAYLATAPDGAEATDCAARPHLDEAIRMVINCTHTNGLVTTYFVGPRGASVPAPQGSSA